MQAGDNIACASRAAIASPVVSRASGSVATEATARARRPSAGSAIRTTDQSKRSRKATPRRSSDSSAPFSTGRCSVDRRGRRDDKRTRQRLPHMTMDDLKSKIEHPDFPRPAFSLRHRRCCRAGGSSPRSTAGAAVHRSGHRWVGVESRGSFSAPLSPIESAPAAGAVRASCRRSASATYDLEYARRSRSRMRCRKGSGC